MRYSNTTAYPTGISWLSGDILPWQDYYIFQVDSDNMYAVYGTCDSLGHFDSATVRHLYRTGSNVNRYWRTDEQTVTDVTVAVDYPYYCYSNVIGQPVELVSSYQITCSLICGAVACLSIYLVFALLRNFRRCFNRAPIQ